MLQVIRFYFQFVTEESSIIDFKQFRKDKYLHKLDGQHEINSEDNQQFTRKFQLESAPETEVDEAVVLKKKYHKTIKTHQIHMKQPRK